MYIQNKCLKDALRSKEFLIVAHKGSHGGNVIENTRLSAKIAFMEGADIVEIDVIKSADGKFYCFHDGSEGYLTRVKPNFLEMNGNEIEAVNLLNSSGTPSGYGVESLSNLLKNLKVGEIINIDRSWNYWHTLLDFFDE